MAGTRKRKQTQKAAENEAAKRAADNRRVVPVSQQQMVVPVSQQNLPPVSQHQNVPPVSQQQNLPPVSQQQSVGNMSQPNVVPVPQSAAPINYWPGYDRYMWPGAQGAQPMPFVQAPNPMPPIPYGGFPQNVMPNNHSNINTTWSSMPAPVPVPMAQPSAAAGSAAAASVMMNNAAQPPASASSVPVASTTIGSTPANAPTSAPGEVPAPPAGKTIFKHVPKPIREKIWKLEFVELEQLFEPLGKGSVQREDSLSESVD